MTDYEKEMLEKDIRKGFGLVERGYYEVGDFIVFHKTHADKVIGRETFLGIITGFIAGTLITALFNWIF